MASRWCSMSASSAGCSLRTVWYCCRSARCVPSSARKRSAEKMPAGSRPSSSASARSLNESRSSPFRRPLSDMLASSPGRIALGVVARCPPENPTASNSSQGSPDSGEAGASGMQLALGLRHTPPLPRPEVSLRRLAPLSTLPELAEDHAGEVDRHREDDRRRLVAGDLRQGLQVAELHRLRLLGEQLRGLEQRLRRLLLPLGMDHLRPTLALGLGLARDRADHRLVQVDVLDLDVRHLDAPGIGLRVEDALDVEVELLPLGEHLVELVLAEHRAQRGLRELVRRGEEIFDLDDRLLGVDHPEEHDRVHLDRHVVARDDVLARHVEDDDPQVDLDHLLDPAHDEHQPGPLDLPEPAEHEDDAALVLAQDAQAREDERPDGKDEDEERVVGVERHGQPPLESGVTSSTRPSTAITRTRLPGASRSRLRTRQVSPRTRAHASSPALSITSPPAPTRSSRPVTTGRVRAFAAMPPTKITNSAVANATPTMSGIGTP